MLTFRCFFLVLVPVLDVAFVLSPSPCSESISDSRDEIESASSLNVASRPRFSFRKPLAREISLHLPHVTYNHVDIVVLD